MKTLQKTIAIVALATLLFSTNLFAQPLSATADVKIQLKKALSIGFVDGSLDFGELLVTGAPQAPSITRANGAHFLVTGHPGKNVTINYSNVTLDNNDWSDANADASNYAVMTFTAGMDHTGLTAPHAGGTSIADGAVVGLVNDTGTGKLNLWVGGSIAVAAGQNHGDYEGTLTVDVAY